MDFTRNLSAKCFQMKRPLVLQFCTSSKVYNVGNIADHSILTAICIFTSKTWREGSSLGCGVCYISAKEVKFIFIVFIVGYSANTWKAALRVIKAQIVTHRAGELAALKCCLIKKSETLLWKYRSGSHKSFLLFKPCRIYFNTLLIVFRPYFFDLSTCIRDFVVFTCA